MLYHTPRRKPTFAHCLVCDDHGIPCMDLTNHLVRSHGLGPEEYYMQYVLKIEERPRCANPRCRGYAEFKDVAYGYQRYCSVACVVKCRRAMAG